jgi:hypothetical protein
MLRPYLLPAANFCHVSVQTYVYVIFLILVLYWNCVVGIFNLVHRCCIRVIQDVSGPCVYAGTFFWSNSQKYRNMRYILTGNGAMAFVVHECLHITERFFKNTLFHFTTDFISFRRRLRPTGYTVWLSVLNVRKVTFTAVQSNPTKTRWVLTLLPRRFFPGKNFRHALNTRLRGSHSRCGLLVRKIPWPC